MTSRIAAILLLSALPGACATPQAPRALTAPALERAKVACRAPDAALARDEHLSIVFPSDTPDRDRQIQCLFDWVPGHGYWVDQIVTEHAGGAGL